MRNQTRFLTAILLLIASGAAFAHPGHDISGLAAGLKHPLTGFDHLLAMVAVGLWAAQGNSKERGGRKIWLLPATFMTMLAAGAALAMHWQSPPMVEAEIASSVLALGLLVALSARLPVTLSIAITGLFGLLHGYAHGLELPESAAPGAFALGFLIATASLHLSGIAIGVAANRYHAQLSRLLGGTIALAGAYLLVT